MNRIRRWKTPIMILTGPLTVFALISHLFMDNTGIAITILTVVILALLAVTATDP